MGSHEGTRAAPPAHHGFVKLPAENQKPVEAGRFNGLFSLQINQTGNGK
jgi:hypothetical protein